VELQSEKSLMTLHIFFCTYFLCVCNHVLSCEVGSFNLNSVQFPISYCNNIYPLILLPISFRRIVGIERNLACAHAKYYLFALFFSSVLFNHVQYTFFYMTLFLFLSVMYVYFVFYIEKREKAIYLRDSKKMEICILQKLNQNTCIESCLI